MSLGLVYSSLMFGDKTNKLKNDINAKDAVLHEFLSSFDSVCQDSSVVLSLLLPPEQKASPRKKARQEKVSNPTPVLYNLSKSLLNLRAELLSLLGVQDDALLPKQAESSVFQDVLRLLNSAADLRCHFVAPL